MTIQRRLQRARRVLQLLWILAALGWSVAAALAVVLVSGLLVRWDLLPDFIRVGLTPAIALAGAAALIVALWAGRHTRSPEKFALWVEEQQGGLDHALVTAADPLIQVDRYPDLHRRAAAADPAHAVRQAAGRLLGWPLALVLVLGVIQHWFIPAGWTAAGSSRTPPAAASTLIGDRLTQFSVRIRPPAYAGLPDSIEQDPASIIALSGSELRFSAAGNASGIVAHLGADSTAAATDGDRWALSLKMPRGPVAVTLTDRDYHRLIALVPRVDSAPSVRLRLPAADTTYQTVPRGALQIEAALRDDIGLATAQVEYLISSGSDEEFETRAASGKPSQLSGVKSGLLRETILFDTLHLAPGSVLHIRVVALDRNDISGPGKGTSETRTLRIAEPVDSTVIDAAPPPPIDSMWISQRLLNMKTDSLIGVQRRLAPADFSRRSDDYSIIQESLRQRTLGVITEIEGDEEDPSSQTTPVTRRLRQVAELMATARTHLAAAEPRSAIPFMRRILAVLDELRLANRYYLRGHPRPMAVNLERTRLSGGDPVHRALRTPRPPSPDSLALLAGRVERLLALPSLPPRAMADSLVLLRVDAARQFPALAILLDSAAAALSRGAPVGQALAPVRRALEPAPARQGGPVTWTALP